MVTNANRLRTYKPIELVAHGAASTVRTPKVEVREQKEQKEETMATVKDPVYGMGVDPQPARSIKERHIISVQLFATPSSRLNRITTKYDF